ncbi:TRNA-modifying protein like [Actinidia chinensis var. chinensis]|uniref:tRNA-modifying protein like n=1 Tax=Actinidia chinensis var. chinensis TaxID=1590841 RepID=A0A2R6R2B1_ACTCC|nr:TRNA-modifying protein like [Actinidia chinensis var. chinensis]
MMLMTIPTTASSFSLTHRLRPNPRLPVFTRHFNTVKTIATTKPTTRRRRWAVSPSPSSSENQTVVTEPTTTASAADDESQPVSYTTSSEVVRNFYEGINRHDLAAVEKLIAHNCVYEDLIFPQPFVGREAAILAFFQKFIDSISTDLQFAIDDISNEDTTAVGVTWHLEWKGKPFPFSKGCSFYRLDVVNGKRQIIYGRDSVEPAIKPGETALVAIRGVTWLLQQFPQLADQLQRF